jgi:hypothetical protein
MKRFANAKFLLGLLVYAVIVAVTFGIAFGGRYHKPAGETGDAIAAASPVEGSGAPSDSVTSATPNGGTIPSGESADALTAASPLSSTSGSYTPPDSTTGASPGATTSPTAPPDSVTAPSPAPAPTPGTTPPPDVITQPSPAPAPGTTPSPTPGGGEQDEVDEVDEVDTPGEALNLLYIFAPLAMFGMTFFGLSAFTRRRKEED